ncbi:hypothetical protein [Clostridium perfringens]|uniref:hypothetical protein n=1 Tax=Clostridium perfringens TaxID=1502 RepID=UPI003A0FFF2F
MKKFKVIENIDKPKVICEIYAENVDDAIQEVKVKFEISINRLYSDMYIFEEMNEK